MFYDKFKDLCDQKGVSLSKAAKEIGLSNATCTHWKKDGSIPKEKTLVKIAEYFGVSVTDLLSFNHEQAKKDTTQYTLSDVMKMADEMKDAIPSMSPEQIADMYALWIMRGYIDNPSTSDE